MSDRIPRHCPSCGAAKKKIWLRQDTGEAAEVEYACGNRWGVMVQMMIGPHETCLRRQLKVLVSEKARLEDENTRLRWGLDV